MRAAAVAGESTPPSDGGERVARLFPKCRPRSRHDRISIAMDGEGDASSEDETPVIGNKGGYRLRDSRIIEIAGGRELYSQSRSKAARKLRHSSTHKHNARNKMRALSRDTSDYAIDTLSNEMGSQLVRVEVNATNGRASGIPRNSSPVLDPHARVASPLAASAAPQLLPFDDNRHWQDSRTEIDGSDTELRVDNVRHREPELRHNDSDTRQCDSELNNRSGASSDGWAENVARVIGELPIAEYEGSPRRYGRSSPRPGYPQRMVEEEQSDDIAGRADSIAFDYLYEFSETRKVLEEFFRCAPPSSHHVGHFQDLEYELRRGSGAAGCDASPHAQHNHTDFLGLQGEPSRFESPNVGALSVWSARGSPDSARSSAPDSDALHAELADIRGELEVVVAQLPAVEDGLSSGHASDADNNNRPSSPSMTIEEAVEVGGAIETEDDRLQPLPPRSCSDSCPPPPAPAPHRPTEPAPPIAVQHPINALHSPSLSVQHQASNGLQVNNTPHHHHSPLHEDIFPEREGAASAASADSADIKPASPDDDEADTDLETDRLLGQQRNDDHGFYEDKNWRKTKSRTLLPLGSTPADDDTQDKDSKKKSKSKEDSTVLIEGVLFRARYLGSTQLACEGQPTKATRMMQAEEAVARIKAPEGESQPSTEVDLFISTEKIMVLNTELKEIMMDHALRTISYIADIGELVVLMARRRPPPSQGPPADNRPPRTPKMICHVFESEEAQFIAQSIGQAFQVAYMEFLKANGIEDHSFVKEMDYQEVLNSQEIFGDELQMFARKELQKEVVVPKGKGEILGVVVVESGWGSMLPTVVIANLAPAGAAARTGLLNIGDQIIAINGVSLVGLPLATCQAYIKGSRTQTVVKLTVVPCAPVVEVKIKRPDTKYQLGFSVQNGVICSLLRGGIAERGGVRVGHRIIEINAQSVVAVPHERIVNLLATSVGEILMKTMPTSMFRLLTGQENPVFI